MLGGRALRAMAVSVPAGGGSRAFLAQLNDQQKRHWGAGMVDGSGIPAQKGAQSWEDATWPGDQVEGQPPMTLKAGDTSHIAAN
jgi:hypothetical protein